MRQRYFSEPLHGTPHRRYYLLNDAGTKYVQITISRPDGKEVPQPANVTDGRKRKEVQLPRRMWMPISLRGEKKCLTCEQSKAPTEFGKGEGRYRTSNICNACVTKASARNMELAA